jgi:hypothetical protein
MIAEEEGMRRSTAMCLLMCALSGCGGGSAPSVNALPAAPVGEVYAQSVVLGRLTPGPVSIIGNQDGKDLAIVAPAASVLLSAGQNPLVSSYKNAATPGVIVACVSAPTSGTGVVDNINLGVNVRSVAVLLDDNWRLVADTKAAFSELAGRRFENWENCGEKPEGRPSLASRLTVQNDGGYAEDVYDGNFGTNLNIISMRYDASQVAAMLSPDGWLNPGTGFGAKRVWIKIYKHVSGVTLMVQQGWPSSGGPDSGFLAVYFQN